MNEVFDLVGAILESVEEFVSRTGVAPSVLSLSPASYRRMIEIGSSEQPTRDSAIGCPAIDEIDTAFGRIRVVIDELLPDTSVDLV